MFKAANPDSNHMIRLHAYNMLLYTWLWLVWHWNSLCVFIGCYNRWQIFLKLAIKQPQWNGSSVWLHPASSSPHEEHWSVFLLPRSLNQSSEFQEILTHTAICLMTTFGNAPNLILWAVVVVAVTVPAPFPAWTSGPSRVQGLYRNPDSKTILRRVFTVC